MKRIVEYFFIKFSSFLIIASIISLLTFYLLEAITYLKISILTYYSYMFIPPLSMAFITAIFIYFYHSFKNNIEKEEDRIRLDEL